MELNTPAELFSYRDKYKAEIKRIATECTTTGSADGTVWTIEELIEACNEASEGSDIDLGSPAAEAAGIPSSGEYDGYTMALGAFGHCVLYMWAYEVLQELPLDDDGDWSYSLYRETGQGHC